MILTAFSLVMDNELLSIYRLTIGDGINKSATQYETNEVCGQENTMGTFFSFEIIFSLVAHCILKKSSPMRNVRTGNCRKKVPA